MLIILETLVFIRLVRFICFVKKNKKYFLKKMFFYKTDLLKRFKTFKTEQKSIVSEAKSFILKAVSLKFFFFF